MVSWLQLGAGVLPISYRSQVQTYVTGHVLHTYSTHVAAESCQIACVVLGCSWYIHGCPQGLLVVGRFQWHSDVEKFFPHVRQVESLLFRHVSASQVVFCMLAALMVATVTWTRVKLQGAGETLPEGSERVWRLVCGWLCPDNLVCFINIYQILL